MVRLLVISDTHSPRHMIPNEFYELFNDDNDDSRIDGIIHCGDIQEVDVYEDLLSLGKPVYGVLGNNYDYSLARLLPRRRVIFFEDISIGIIHGNGASSQAIINARREFNQEEVDLVCFGHSHIAATEFIDERCYFNPGSLTCSRKGNNSYGIIEIEGKAYKVYIKEIKKIN